MMMFISRAAGLSLDLSAPPTNEPVHLVLDSTGLKVYGEGQWKVRKHGVSKRRTWRKLHLGIDESTGYIYGEVLTDNGSGGDDAAQVASIVEQTTAPIDKLSADGAYDKVKVLAVARRRRGTGYHSTEKRCCLLA